MMHYNNTVQTARIFTPELQQQSSETNTSPSLFRRWVQKGATLSLCTLGICTAYTSSAQVPNVKTHLYHNDDLKHYATSQLIGNDEYAMAGTVFNYAGAVGDHGVHLLVHDLPGNPVVSHVYNDPNYDERVVGVHYLTSTDVAIVASRVAINGIVDPSGIEIIRADASNGTQMSNYVVQPPVGSGLDYWPMGSVTYNNGRIYICGYVTPSVPPGSYPGFTTSKSAFVMVYDISTNMIAAVNTYDWPVGGANDYDIAHRLKVLNNGDIWVGGMCNGGGTQSMMNMIIDPSLNVVMDAPVQQAIPSSYALSTSFDYWEDVTNPSLGYVFGNHCFNLSSTVMDLFPMFVNITSVDASTLNPSPGLNNQAWMGQIDYAWGTNVVRGNNSSMLVLSGFQSNYACGGQSNPTSQDNVNPFLAELIPTTTGGNISIATNYWHTMESVVGTGSRTLDPNSYYNLGGAMSNLTWGPVTTVRDDGTLTNDIVLNTPVWNKVTNRLNIKTIRTDLNGDPNCKFGQCAPYFPTGQAITPGFNVFAMSTSWFDFNQMIPDGPLNINALLGCSSGYFRGEGSKLNNIAPQNSLAVSVYPNPAQDRIQLQFKGTINDADAVHVNITDMSGKTISVLYHGPKSGLDAQLKLPQLAKGTYLIMVYHNANQLQAIPVVIN